jgi:hypothetical protein
VNPANLLEGNYELSVVINLVTYPAVTLTKLMKATITPCIVTGYTMGALSPTYDKTYIIADPSLSWILPVITV